MRIFQGLGGMPCGSAGRRGVETSWQGIGMTRLCDDAGQQRLRKVKERLAPAASAARAEVAQEAQESRDEGMTEASVTSDAENVKPRIEESREDSTPAVGLLELAEVRSRSEGVLPSEKKDQGVCVLPRTRWWSMQMGWKCASP